MAMRISPEFVGTQFHPEADPEGMRDYYAHAEKRMEIIKQHGEMKYEGMMDALEDNDADSILNTYNHVLPTFLDQARCNLLQCV
jgi:GMP synthase-like glutamine amidotransferase